MSKCGLCDSLATHGFDDPTHCFIHKETSMKITINYDKIDGYSMKTKSGFCIYCECGKHASFNFLGENKAIFCNSHKLFGMCNVNSKKCAYIDCLKQPCYNKTGEKKGKYCSEHKEEGMVDVVNPKCMYDKCNKKPNYNYSEQSRGLYCKDHRLKNMIDVIHDKCISEGCDIRAIYNYSGEHKGLYCFAHKLDRMINVHDKKCKFVGCDKIPNFNNSFENTPLYCKDHKLEGMIDIKNNQCKTEGCIKRSFYNISGVKQAMYCNEHKTFNMVNVVSPRCKTVGCETIAQVQKYQGFCFYCFINTFPNNDIVRNIRVKEREFIDPIKILYKDRFVYDRVINGGCSLRRPDAFCDCLTHTLMIEIDESGHRDYDIPCETIRVNELYTDCGDRPQVSLRINPDNYKDENGKIKKCFRLHKFTGVLLIDDKIELKKRIDKMMERIEYWLTHIPSDGLTVEKLFY